MIDWRHWHAAGYGDPDSPLSRRLAAVRRRIGEVLDRAPAGEIRVASICAGDGRDLLAVLQTHPRARDVIGTLIELDPGLVARARANAPAAIRVERADAGVSDPYASACPVDLLLCCGVFGNISEGDIRNTIGCWSMLCAPGATAIWTRYGGPTDIRPRVRRWIQEAGFEEVAYDLGDDEYGVGVARMVRAPEPFRPGVRFFRFLPERVGCGGPVSRLASRLSRVVRGIGSATRRALRVR